MLHSVFSRIIFVSISGVPFYCYSAFTKELDDDKKKPTKKKKAKILIHLMSLNFPDMGGWFEDTGLQDATGLNK